MNNTLTLCYWLQGFAEINKKKPNKSQWEHICTKVLDCEIDDTDDTNGGPMKPSSFVSWLKGFVELASPESIDARRWSVIEEHLGLVFSKVTTINVTDPVDINILKELTKERINGPNKFPKNPQVYPPSVPWNPPTYPLTPDIVCSATDPSPSDAFCLSIENACALYNADPIR